MTKSIPNAWVAVRLSEVAEVRLGRQRSPQRATGPHMRPYMRAANVTWKGIDTDDVKKMDFSPSEFEVYALRDGDILLSEASGSASEVGKPAIWRGEIPDCCFQNTLIRVRPAARDLVEFLHLHFMMDALTGTFALASRGVGIHHLGAEAMTEWDVVIPPAKERRAIVDAIASYFSRLDDTTATLERVQRKLKRYRASVLKAAVEGRLVPTEAELARAEKREYEPASELLKRILVERRRRWEEAELAKLKAAGKAPKDDKWKAKYKEPVALDTTNLPTLPEGWCWATLEQLCSTITDGDHLPPPQTESGVPFLVIGDVRNGKVDLADTRFVSREYYESLDPTRQPRAGDLLYTVTGSYGIPVYVRGTDEFCVQRHIAILRPLFTINARFMLRALESQFVFEQAHSGATGTAQKTVPLKTLRRFAIPLPPDREQTRLLEYVEQRMSIAGSVGVAVELQLARVVRLRQSILKRAFEGTLIDQDPADEPASVLLDRIRAERAAATQPKESRPRRAAKTA